MTRKHLFILLVTTAFSFVVYAGTATNLTGSVSTKPPSEDPIIKNLHWMGSIDGQTNILRCACPVMDVAGQMKSARPTEADLKLARERMQHLRDLGVRTVISFQHQAPLTENETNVEHIAVALERIAAKDVGLLYVAYPMANNGKNSFEDMSDDAALKLLDSVTDDILKYARTGGVAFHCKSGKDRTGIVAAYLRMKYQHWTAAEAIAEMRRYGHVWNKFSKDGATNSWHEAHLLAIASATKLSSP